MAQEHKALKAVAGGLGLGVAAYLAYVAKALLRYGRMSRSASDVLLDRYMPTYHVREHHRVHVAAPADVALRAAREMDMSDSPLPNALFKMRQLIMRGRGPDKNLRGGMVEMMQSLGWVTLGEIPGREIALGTGAQPWLADGDFRRIPSDEFRAFEKPKYVKIALTLKAEPINSSECYLSTETRAIATDESARRRFRIYWAFLSPGIRLLRWPMMARAKRIAQQNVRLGEVAA